MSCLRSQSHIKPGTPDYLPQLRPPCPGPKLQNETMPLISRLRKFDYCSASFYVLDVTLWTRLTPNSQRSAHSLTLELWD